MNIFRHIQTTTIALVMSFALVACDSLPTVSMPDFSSGKSLADRGIAVVSIDPGTEAARQGMQTGDVIIEVNGDDIYNKDDLVAAFVETGRLFRSNRIIALRDGKEMRFNVRTNLKYSGIVTKSETGIMSPTKSS